MSPTFFLPTDLNLSHSTKPNRARQKNKRQKWSPRCFRMCMACRGISDQTAYVYDEPARAGVSACTIPRRRFAAQSIDPFVTWDGLQDMKKRSSCHETTIKTIVTRTSSPLKVIEGLYQLSQLDVRYDTCQVSAVRSRFDNSRPIDA